MDPDDLKLSSVNWEHGMLLTPDHFLRQERYFESALLWALRYAIDSYGLVGGGPRLPESERGAVRHDPIVVVDQTEDSVGITVSQCRGLTPNGCIIEIDPSRPLSRQFPKAELDGISEAPIYIACDPRQKEVADGTLDEFNPQMKTERRPAYFLSLQIHADSAPYSIAAGRLRKQRYAAGFEKDPDFIPACVSLASYSELAAAWRKTVDKVTLLAERYTELHRAMREFLVLFAERGIETDTDVETAAFVDRMVVALQNCVYEILDPVQSPQRFFGYLRRFLHSAAVYLDLTPAVQQYFDTLKETGENEFISLIEQQRKLLMATRTWSIHDNLAVEVRSTAQALETLHRLEQALEGKYIDFHLSPSLEGMNFVFDRGGKALYKLAAKPARVQGFADEITIHFSQLRLEGRDKYRLILVGEQNAVFEKGTKLSVEIRVNEGSGFRRPAILLSCESKMPEQRNFEFDFDAPDVPTITDLRVSLQAHHPVRTALLFARYRFFANRAQEGPAPRAVEPIAPVPEPLPPPPPSRPAPWDSPRDVPRDAPRKTEKPPEPPPPPPRRRRLE